MIRHLGNLMKKGSSFAEIREHWRRGLMVKDHAQIIQSKMLRML